MDTITSLPTTQQKSWLKKKGKELKNQTEIENGAVLNQTEILWEVSSIWPTENNLECECLTPEAISDWQGDFYKWAAQYTKSRPDKEPAKITIDNKIAVHRDWVAEPVIEPPKYVKLDGEKVEFDLSQVPYGKRLIAKGKAKRGEMTPEDWAALMDTNISASKLGFILSGKESNDTDFSIFERDGIVYGAEDGKVIPVYHRDYTDHDDPLYQKTVKHILKSLGQYVPENA